MFSRTSPGPPIAPETWPSSPSAHQAAMPLHAHPQALGQTQVVYHHHDGRDWDASDPNLADGASDLKPRRPGLRVHAAAGSSDESGSPTGSVADIRADQSGASSSGKAKRSLSEASIERRKAQNRTAQKAFRERKERYVRDLEERCALQSEEIRVLRMEIQRLTSGGPGVPGPQQGYPAPPPATHGYWAQPAPSAPAASSAGVAGYPANSAGPAGAQATSTIGGYGYAAPPPGPEWASIHPTGRSHERYPGMQIPSVMSAAYPGQSHHQPQPGPPHAHAQHTPSPYSLQHPSSSHHHHPSQHHSHSQNSTPTAQAQQGHSSATGTVPSEPPQPQTQVAYPVRPSTADPSQHSRAASRSSVGGP